MKLMWIFLGVGGFVGGLLPSLFGADISSLWSILTTAIGSILGVWLYKYLDLE